MSLFFSPADVCFWSRWWCLLRVCRAEAATSLHLHLNKWHKFMNVKCLSIRSEFHESVKPTWEMSCFPAAKSYICDKFSVKFWHLTLCTAWNRDQWSSVAACFHTGRPAAKCCTSNLFSTFEAVGLPELWLVENKRANRVWSPVSDKHIVNEFFSLLCK